MATENNDDGDEKVLYKYVEEASKTRISSNPIHPVILSKRSLRSMTGQALSDDQIMVLFEAAHFNGQLWRFVYAKRESEHWDGFLGALTEANQLWARYASVLVVVLSKSTMLNPYSKEDEYVKSHHFEAGAAWMAMTLEGTSRGLVLHALNGFDSEMAKDAIGLTDDSSTGLYTVEVMIAIGVPDLYNAEWEEITLRRDIDYFISEGVFVEKSQEEEIALDEVKAQITNKVPVKEETSVEDKLADETEQNEVSAEETTTKETFEEKEQQNEVPFDETSTEDKPTEDVEQNEIPVEEVSVEEKSAEEMPVKEALVEEKLAEKVEQNETQISDEILKNETKVKKETENTVQSEPDSESLRPTVDESTDKEKNEPDNASSFAIEEVNTEETDKELINENEEKDLTDPSQTEPEVDNSP